MVGASLFAFPQTRDFSTTDHSISSGSIGPVGPIERDVSCAFARTRLADAE